MPGLVSNLTSNAINKLERKIREKGAVRAGKRFTLFNSKEDMNDIIKIIKSLEDSGVLIDGVTETVKQESGVLGALALLAASIRQPVTSSLVESISGRWVRTVIIGYTDKNF